MALQSCRECGKQVSTEAPACPHCRIPAHAQTPIVDRQSLRSTDDDPTELRKAQLRKLVLPFAAVLLLIGAVKVFSVGESVSSREAAAGISDDDIQADVMGRLRESLLDPNSADFRNVVVVRRPDVEAVCGELNADNGYGGRTGYKRFIGGATAIFVEGQPTPAQFDDAWDRICIEIRPNTP